MFYPELKWTSLFNLVFCGPVLGRGWSWESEPVFTMPFKTGLNSARRAACVTDTVKGGKLLKTLCQSNSWSSKGFQLLTTPLKCGLQSHSLGSKQTHVGLPRIKGTLWWRSRDICLLPCTSCTRRAGDSSAAAPCPADWGREGLTQIQAHHSNKPDLGVLSGEGYRSFYMLVPGYTSRCFQLYV